jgi:hypothetical protein
MRLYKKAYKILENITPLNMDCGIICNKACCMGGDEKGMLLFPGEELYLEKQDFLKILPTNITLENGRKLYMATCEGKCERKFRPLSCMIFPLIPIIQEDRIFMEIDLRGINTCPIVDDLISYELDSVFIDSVYKVFEIVQKLKDGFEFIKILDKIQNDTKEFIQKVTG